MGWAVRTGVGMLGLNPGKGSGEVAGGLALKARVSIGLREEVAELVF